MFRSRSDRRLATALFVDIVDSTRIAAEVGDRTWNALLGRFRRAVRSVLRTHGGHEEDTAGDGFFATFRSPDAAVRAAVAIVAGAAELGIRVRCGLHTGEMERIDGRLGGIAAHIAARVVSLAPGAGVAVTSTVRDLVVGGGISFDALGEAELKGVPGRWALHRVADVDGRPIQPALDEPEAARRRAAGTERPARSSWRLGLGAAAALASVALAVAAWRSAAAPAGPVASPSPSAPLPVALVRIDPRTNEVTDIVRDGHVGSATLLTMGGSMWLWDERTLIRRNLRTGALEASQPVPAKSYDIKVAFGSIWIAHDKDDTRLDRVDPISGRLLEQFDPEANLWDYAAGEYAMWALGAGRQLLEIDPLANTIVDRRPTGTDGEAVYLSSTGGLLYLFEWRPPARITVLDPKAGTVVRTFDYEMRGFGAVDRNGTMWVVDGDASTITPVDTVSGVPDRSIGLAGSLDGGAVAFGFDATWVAAGEFVYRISWESRRVIPIPMPTGALASDVAIDEESTTVWTSGRSTTP